MFMMSDLKNSFIFSIELVCIVRFYLILKNTCRGQHYTHQCTGCRALWKEEDFFFSFFLLHFLESFQEKKPVNTMGTALIYDEEMTKYKLLWVE